MTVPVLIHPYTAAAGVDTTELGGASLRHTLQLLGSLERPALSVLPRQMLPALTDALRDSKCPSELIVHPGRLGSCSAVLLAALHVIAQERDPVLFVCQNPLRLSDGLRLLALVQQGTAAAEGGALVSLATQAPLNGHAAARHQLLVARDSTDGTHRVQRVGHKLGDAAGGTLLFHATGAYLARASTLVIAMSELAPETLQACRRAMEQARHGRAGLRALVGRRHLPGIPGCTWPDATCLLRAGSADIEHKLLGLSQPHFVLPSDGSWLAPARALPRPAPVRAARPRQPSLALQAA